MNKTYLLTRPEHDDTTHYLSIWSKETITLAQNHRIKVLDLHRERATKSEVEGVISKFSPNLVLFNGHGNDNTIAGHGNQPIVTVGKNEEILKSKIVYAVSCKSAKCLGPKSIEAGAISYTGYDDDFIFVYEPEKVSRPLQDETVKLFLEPSNLFIDSLIKGNTIKESRKRTEDMFRRNIVKALGSTIQDDASIVRFLWWNRRHFVSHGDLDARL